MLIPLACAALAATSVPALAAPLFYDVTTQTGMPHLDESLRYATVTVRRCVDRSDLSRQFWMLDDVSLQDCRLIKTSESPPEAAYALRCDGGHGTSGNARWQFEADGRMTGQLDVRLGGKNMTFYQRIVATPVGACR